MGGRLISIKSVFLPLALWYRQGLRQRMTNHQTICTFIFVLSIVIGSASSLAQSPSPVDPDTGVGLDPTLKSVLTPEFLNTKIQEAEGAVDLDQTSKNKLIGLYRQSLSDLEATSAMERKAGAYKQSLELAPARAQAIRDELATRPTEMTTEMELPTSLSITDIEQRLAKTQAEEGAVEAKLTELEKEVESSTTRPAEIRKRIEEAKQELEAVDTEISLPTPEGQSSAVTEASRWALEARRQALRAEILMLDQELLSHDARVEVLKAAREKTASDLALLKSAEQKIEIRLNELLKAQAAEAAEETREAQRQAAGKHSLVQDFAQQNAALSEELTKLTAGLNRFSGVQEQIEEQTLRIGEDFRNARQRLQVAGLTQALGQVLIDQRKQLPELRDYRKAAAEREDLLTQATLRQIRYAEEQRGLRDVDAYVESLFPDTISDEEQVAIITELRELAEQRAALLDQAAHTNEAYLRMLGEIDYASSKLMRVAEEYDAFLSEHLLWVRSTQPINFATFADLPKSIAWAIAPNNWLEVVHLLLHEARHSFTFWLLLLIIGVLQWKSRAMQHSIRSSAEHLRRIRTDSVRYTLEALVLTLLVAAPLPLLLAFLGWTLSVSLETTAFTKAIGNAAISVSLGLFYLRSFRVLCMSGGVAERHFGWKAEVLTLLRHNFDWLLAVLVPLGFMAISAYSYPGVTYSGSLGRLSLIGLMLGLSVFAARVLHPQRGALHNWIEEHPMGWFSRLRRLWYPFVVAVPLLLAILAVTGYHYTATVLLRALISSMYLVLGITVAHQLIVRWLVLTRRRLALQVALDRRAARTKETTSQSEQEIDPSLKLEEEQVPDFASLDERTRQFINTFLFLGGVLALWSIWAPILPAFGVLDQITLWNYTRTVEGEDLIIPVTLADFGQVLVIVLIAIVAVKNLPALLEILLLSRISLSAGNRYAVKALTAYIITAAAALTIFGTLGLSWGEVQWLVAALGVGIGFGLQEIVANFISGIIILFERPVRVGDIVTIGDTTGVVTKIRIRATTIRNWDKQELLVPNKEFITGRLLNWTLSDNLNRIVIPVGVDYGADVPRALKLLEQVATEHERVLDDPAPLITFESFGDNALNLILRCFIDSLEHRLSIISELHQSINNKFRAADISIAFPQRDVHLSADEPLDVRVHQEWPETAEPKTPVSSDINSKTLRYNR